jgi:two-component system alkaline phosphatase synthesis response regulator PhoP
MSTPGGFERVLVVDDEEDLRTLVGWVLKDAGVEVELASDGWSAIEKIEAHPPQLVLLDLIMPGIDGWRVMEHLRGLPAPPPVVLLTACTDFGTFARGVREGAVACVLKPFRPRDLLATCERVLRGGAKRASALTDERRTSRRALL